MRNSSIYIDLWNENISLIKSNKANVDNHLNCLNLDHRKGITLVCRPDNLVANNIASFVEELNIIEPNQYYYDDKQLHTTILPIIATGSRVDYEKLNLKEYFELIEKKIQGTTDFKIRYTGVTTSSGALLIQGFPEDETLSYIRDRLRKVFASSTLFATLDTRYHLETAHMTCVRYSTAFNNTADFVHKLEEFRMVDFGVSTVDRLDLVLNDWYLTQEKTKIIGSLKLQ